MATMARRKLVALLSGGLDSTVALAHVRSAYDHIWAITVNYGQHAAVKESRASRHIAEFLACDHRVIDLPWLGALGTSALTTATAMPEPAPECLDDAEADNWAAQVWVPNRNGVLLNVAAAIAEVCGAGAVLMGFNREEAATFSDNSPEFHLAANAALRYSVRQPVRLVAPTMHLDKRQIVELGLACGAPLGSVWVCYRGGEEHCGRCESCRRFARALAAAGATSTWQSQREEEGCCGC